MKKPQIRNLLLLATSVGALHAAPLINEPFDYPTGALNGTTVGVSTGLTGNWDADSTYDITAAPGPVYGNIAYSGNAVTCDPGGSHSDMAVSNGWLSTDAQLQDGAELWFSVSLKTALVGGANPDFGFALADARLVGTNPVRLNTGEQGIGFRIKNGAIKACTWGNSPTDVSGSSPGLGVNTLVVGKITWGATSGDVDLIEIYLPDETLALGSVVSSDSKILDQSDFTIVTTGQKWDGGLMQIDEIRFGTTSNDVLLPADTTDPAVVSIEDNVGGGPIYEDIVVRYTVTFDQAIDGSSVDVADFVNIGSASIDSGATTVSQVATNVFEVDFYPTSTGTLILEIPIGASIDDWGGNSLDDTVAHQDDTTITILSGTTPVPDFRMWDGPLTTGPTDGVSNGGNATWNTTTTNWDYTAGLASPVAWNNANNDTAIFGGSPVNVTLGEDVTVGGITFTSNDYRINKGAGTTLTFGAAGTIHTDTNNSRSDAAWIAADVAGAAITKTGTGYIRLDGTCTFSSFTLNGGGIGELQNGTYDGFGPGLLTINSGTIYTNNDGSGTTTIPNDMQWGGNFTVENVSASGHVTQFDGDVALTSDVTLGSKMACTLIGVISGPHQLTLQDAGGNAVFSLNGANTLTGGINWIEDDLNINHASALGTGTFAIDGTANILDNTSGSPITIIANNDQLWDDSFTFAGSNDLNLGTGVVSMTRDITVEVAAGTLTVGGGIGESGGNRSLTKTGSGTLALGGANTYVNNTNVNAGTLALIGGSQSSAITVASGAHLQLTLNAGTPGTALTSSSSSVNLTNGDVTISNPGAVDNSSDYLLMTAAGGFTFTDPLTQLGTAIPDYQLAVVDNGGVDELWLEYTGGGGGDPYVSWSGGAPFDGDANGDQVQDGLAFMLGVPTLATDANSYLPTVTEDGSGGLVLTFSCLNDASNGDATLNVEHSSDLGITDAWTAELVPEIGGTSGGVTFVVTPNGSLNDVVATISSTEAAAGKLFGRLKAVKP